MKTTLTKEQKTAIAIHVSEEAAPYRPGIVLARISARVRVIQLGLIDGNGNWTSSEAKKFALKVCKTVY